VRRKSFPIILSFAAVVSTACRAFEPLPDLEGEPILLDDRTRPFLAMDPVAFEEFFAEDEVEFYALDDDDAVSREELLYVFPNEAVQVRVARVSAEGKLSLPMASLSAAGQHYEVVVDYAKYRTDRTMDGFVYQSGVGIRIRANVKSFEAGVDISNLFGLGAAAKAGRLSGSLRFETIGIGGKAISTLIPLPTEISVESIQLALQAAAAIKSNIYDEEDVSVYPQVFAYKPLEAAQLSPKDEGRPQELEELEPTEELEPSTGE
jgi:hypothetical protein